MATATGVAPDTRRGRPAGTRTQVLGLSLLAAAPLTMAVIGLVTGVPTQDLAFFVPIGVILAIGAFLAARFGTWSKVLGIVLTVAGAAMVFWMAFGLMAPASPGDFVPGWLFLTGFVLALVGGIGALVAKRRGHLVTAPTSREIKVRAVAIGLVAVAAVASIGINLTGRTSVDPAVAAAATPVTMSGFQFAPGTIEVAAGGDAAVVVRNSDGFVHDLAIPAEGIEATVVQPGSEALVDLSSLPAGTYTSTARCTATPRWLTPWRPGWPRR